MGGTVEPGFEQVRASFERGLARGELGAAVSVYVDGRSVVDLWGGWADAAKTRAWRRDTIADTMSATKGLIATCAHRLVERGLLDVDEPVATYWPEFAQAGKEGVTVRMVLSHQAGQPSPATPVSDDKRLDEPTMTAALAQGRLRSEPGTRSEYLGASFSYLVGELVRRIDGRSLGAYFREEIADPLGVDFLMSVGPEDDGRCAELVGLEDIVGGRNTRASRAANGHGSADGLARVYAALARGGELDGVPLLRAETIEAATCEQSLVNAEGSADPFGCWATSCCGRWILICRSASSATRASEGSWASPTRHDGLASAS